MLNRVLHGGLAALGCGLGAAVLVVAIPAPHAAEPVTVSYHGDLAALTRLAPYPAVAPAGLPRSWQPVGSGLTAGGAAGTAAGTGTVTWALDFMTPDGTLASLEESNSSPASFVRRMTNNGTVLPPSPPSPPRLDGQAWTFSASPARGQRSLNATSPAGFTVVITGNATWADLRLLAASLCPVTPGR